MYEKKRMKKDIANARTQLTEAFFKRNYIVE